MEDETTEYIEFDWSEQDYQINAVKSIISGYSSKCAKREWVCAYLSTDFDDSWESTVDRGPIIINDLTAKTLIANTYFELVKIPLVEVGVYTGSAKITPVELVNSNRRAFSQADKAALAKYNAFFKALESCRVESHFCVYNGFFQGNAEIKASIIGYDIDHEVTPRSPSETQAR